ncbi:protein NATD1-like [Genypterus blacodes]|uniref:protein NATD1-like n=1 Tax=Genypterus blacodes TaxID=154954 RepID=UPI003F76FE1F
MAFRLISRLGVLNKNIRVKSDPAAFSVLNCSGLKVEHDRQNRRFTVSPGVGEGSHESAVLCYKSTAEKEVDLSSTYVPESFRGRGVAALLSKAAMDFVVEENLQARVSCSYIKKYIEDHPLPRYEDLVIT